jgi:hypothetical protein
MGAAAAAAMIRRERETVAAFRRARAVSPESAQPLYAIGVEESRAVARLRRRAVLREASPGAWYLDEPSWTACERNRHRLAAVMLVIVGLLALGAALGVFGR